MSPLSAVETAARRVLTLEAEALAAMAGDLPGGLDKAVALIQGAGGRIIVSGIGKSGHIGRKIAATFASTGTPAYYVHPSEASHGDLGLIGSDDVCLLISNSGETVELSDIIAYTQRFDIPVIAISSRADSTLMRVADAPLLLPHQAEACPMGLAPTTSTTMTLALGDALAVALMEVRGFGAENFATFHPGGKLGAQLARVGQIMHGCDALPLVSQDAKMSETLLVMTSKGFGIAAVVDEDGLLSGVVTDGDLRRNMADLMDRTAGAVATPNPKTIPPDMLAAEALAVLNSAKISVLLVTDADNRPQGVVHIHDLLRAGVV